MCGPGSHVVSTPRLRSSIRKSSVSDAPPRREAHTCAHARRTECPQCAEGLCTVWAVHCVCVALAPTAGRMMCPRSTGTTKVAPKPMLTTTPEVRLFAKRQREAESTMASRFSWKPAPRTAHTVSSAPREGARCGPCTCACGLAGTLQQPPLLLVAPGRALALPRVRGEAEGLGDDRGVARQVGATEREAAEGGLVEALLLGLG